MDSGDAYRHIVRTGNTEVAPFFRRAGCPIDCPFMAEPRLTPSACLRRSDAEATASSRERQLADYDGREISSVIAKIDAAYSLVF
jgi:hypothetical protein